MLAKAKTESVYSKRRETHPITFQKWTWSLILQNLNTRSYIHIPEIHRPIGTSFISTRPGGMTGITKNDALKIKFLISTLKGVAFDWHYQLLENSIPSWGTLAEQFI